MTHVRASYRLQLRGRMTLARVRALVPYLERLGVSHLYLAPVQRARPGSAHGYDVIDPRTVDPVLGGERALARLAHTLRRHGLGAILDVVPNHLAADPRSPFFADVLAHGPASRHACVFDVDWGEPDGRRHRPLLMPVLERPLPETIRRGELSLGWRTGMLHVRRGESAWPLDPATWPVLLERSKDARRALGPLLDSLRRLPPRTRTDARAVRARGAATTYARTVLTRIARGGGARAAALDAALEDRAAGPPGRRRLARLLARQAWRLAPWRSARHRLNYRRFFDVNELIAVRIEDPRVFSAVLGAPLVWMARGWIDGLRVDHVDGLLDPAETLRRLRRAARGPVWVEKILAPAERLPRAWPVEGTTGYDFLNQMEEALLDPDGVRAVERTWARVTGERASHAEAARAGKRRALDELLRADLTRLVRMLEPHAGRRRIARAELQRAVAETIVHLPVYRTYADWRGRLVAGDRRLLAQALAQARRAGRAPARALAWLGRVLLDGGGGVPPALRVTFLLRFQQLSGPAAAKGIEDTAHYAHAALLARHEVGGEPGLPLEDALPRLHAAHRERSRRWPQGLLAASTHDTKRSADVRARLDVLSELPEAWEHLITHWLRANAPLRRRARRRSVPDRNTELFLYQTLVGIWPLPRAGASTPGARALRGLHARVDAHLEKAMREAKRHTSWIDPDPAFEAAVRGFAGDLLLPGRRARGAAFRRELTAFVGEIARPGLWNALARLTVQLTAPGVPDLYQGDEVWCFTLVDPDNRRPVDFARRTRRLASLEAAWRAGPERRRRLLRALRTRPEDERLKLHVVRALLAARRRHAPLFTEGDYVPLRARGPAAPHVVAFARRAGRELAVIVAPRLTRTLVGDGRRAPVGASIWGETRVALPARLAGRPLRDALSGARIGVPRAGAELPVARLLTELPVACWIGRLGAQHASRRRSRARSPR